MIRMFRKKSRIIASIIQKINVSWYDVAFQEKKTVAKDAMIKSAWIIITEHGVNNFEN